MVCRGVVPAQWQAQFSSNILVMPFLNFVLLVRPCSESSITAAQQAVQQQLGSSGLSLLVNNAGVGLVAPAEFVPLDQWRQVLDVNLQGPLAVTQVGHSNLPDTLHGPSAHSADVLSKYIQQPRLCWRCT